MVVGHTVEGVLLLVDPTNQSVVVDTTPNAPERDLHLLHISNIQDFQILSLAVKKETEEAATNGVSAGIPAATKFDVAGLKAREEAAIRKVKDRDAQRGKGVTKEAQDIFDWFART